MPSLAKAAGHCDRLHPRPCHSGHRTAPAAEHPERHPDRQDRPLQDDDPRAAALLLRVLVHPQQGGDCPLHAEGQISEDWEFARGRGTVLIFTKFPGGLVTMRREGRGLGDAAFAAPGGLKRVANGFYDLGPTPCGGSHNFGEEATCGEEFEVNSDLRLQYLKGKLVLDRGSTRQVENPAAPCGEKFGAIDLFTWPYPLLSKQKAPFTKRQIFGRKRGFHLVLKDNFLAPLREPVYESAEEKLNGESDLTLKRLKSN